MKVKKKKRVVYLIFTGFYADWDYNVVAAFGSKKKATAYAKKYNGTVKPQKIS